MERKAKNYLVVFQLSASDQPIISRLQQHVPVIGEILKRLSVRGVDPLMIFRSKDNATFGYCIRSRLPSMAIASQIESPGSNQAEWHWDPPKHKVDLTSPIQAQDRYFVLDVGTDFAAMRYAGHLNWFTQARKLDEEEA